MKALLFALALVLPAAYANAGCQNAANHYAAAKFRATERGRVINSFGDLVWARDGKEGYLITVVHRRPFHRWSRAETDYAVRVKAGTCEFVSIKKFMTRG